MELNINRDVLLKPLQLVCSVADKRQTMPILSNVCFSFKNNRLSLIGSDLEVELIGFAHLEEDASQFDLTVPAKKILDICKSLPEASTISFSLEGERVILRSGNNRFTLSTMPVDEFPKMEDKPGDVEFVIPQNKLKQLFEHTAFAMAQQDVRYYLNGILLKLNNNNLEGIATDGHRLAYASANLESSSGVNTQVILPRKGVLELNKLLLDTDTPVTVVIDKKRITVTGKDYIFTSKLIEGRFPDYERVFPKQKTYMITADKAKFKNALSMASILSNEKHRGVRLLFEPGNLRISANNPEQEEAEVDMPIQFQGESFEIGFNALYLLDVLNVIETPEVIMTLADQRSSALLEGGESQLVARYIIMPLQI